LELMIFGMLASLSASTMGNPVELPGAPIPGPAIVTFWADWCAACKIEARRFEDLAAATDIPIIFVIVDARPDRLAVIPGVPTPNVRVARMTGLDVLHWWPGDAAGLPFAVRLDGKKRACATHNGGLHKTDVLRLAKAC
jgi:hypothetical protein